MGYLAFDLYPRKCKQCGKGFESGTDWAYKERLGHKHFYYFCSWKCLQAFRKERKKC